MPTEGTANTTGVITNPGANVANYNSGADWNGQNGNVTTVGSAAANNFYGTADHGGNVYEWNDTVIESSNVGLRGGAWNAALDSGLGASSRPFLGPTFEDFNVGFRVASVPEPSGLVLTMLASGVMLIRRKR